MVPDLSAGTPQRWFSVGHSALAEAAAAGAQAAQAALAGRSASLLLVFASISYDLPSLLAAVSEAAGEHTAIVGCSSMGEFAARGATDDSVVIAALGGPGFEVRTQLSRDASTRRRESGMEAAAALASIDRPYRALMLLCDGLTFEHHDIVRGAYAVAGATVPLVGGAAADNLTFTGTYQFYGDGTGVEILSDVVVGVALGSDAPIGVGAAHGWRRNGEAMIVTSSTEGQIFQLDDDPALDVYMRLIGEDRSIAEHPDKFHNSAYYHPLGLARRDGEDIRVVHAANPVDGSLICLANVPQGALVWPMESDPDSLISAAGESCTQAVEMLGGAEPIGIVTFDCGARKVMLGYDNVRREVAEIARVAGDAPFCGLYTFGEIARTQGSRGMHHLTVAALALS